MKRLIFLITFAVILFSCDNSPRIDTSSDEAMKTSMEKVKAELSEEKQKELNEALMVLTLSGAFTENQDREDNIINGKTAEEVIELARKVDLDNNDVQGE